MRFKVGDRVRAWKTGATGIVNGIDSNGFYLVQFDDKMARRIATKLVAGEAVSLDEYSSAFGRFLEDDLEPADGKDWMQERI